MFGYVRTDKGELKVKEYELYRGLYCSLCKALSKRYGVLSRFILSYDMTFLVLVRLCEKNISPTFKGGRCPFNPAKKCNYCTNAEEEYDFVCAAAILMFYYKVKDNIGDSRFFKKIFFFSDFFAGKGGSVAICFIRCTSCRLSLFFIIPPQPPNWKGRIVTIATTRAKAFAFYLF